MQLFQTGSILISSPTLLDILIITLYRDYCKVKKFTYLKNELSLIVQRELKILTETLDKKGASAEMYAGNK